VADIKPYELNAKVHPQSQVDDIATSIELYGFVQPLVVDEHNELIIGHGRLLAAQQLGMETVPCVRVTDLTEEEVKALRIVDNKTNESPWDFDKLKTDLQGIDLSAFSFDFDFEDDSPEIDIQEVEPVAIREGGAPRTRVGQLWQLGEHRLYIGDSTEPESYQRLTAGAKVDLLLTDPPYNVDLGSSGGRPITPAEMKQRKRRTDGKIIQNDSMANDTFQDFLIRFLTGAKTVMRPGAAFYIWHADSSDNGIIYREALKAAGFIYRQLLIWVKNTIILGRQDYQWKHEPCLYGWIDGAAHYFCDSRSLPTVVEDFPKLSQLSREELVEIINELRDGTISTTVLHEDKPSRSEEHPTMKPVRLFARQIKNSTREREIVLDPFGGSGTAIIAAEQLNRRCYTMEIDPKYADTILERWETFTGEKAKVVTEYAN
jgi:site-specific DNA-methyltransferase (adenine-specific)